MKKSLLSTFLLAFIAIYSYAGGIVTNTNQSAAYVRMLARDATLGIDAVYYNPAGLPFLGTGLFFSVNNQSIFQNRGIETDYPFLNNGKYEGKVKAPVFPSVYAAFNLSKLSLSFGFNPVGGGGSAEFAEGLPSFEYNISDLTPGLQSLGATGYSTDIYFKGKSIYYGAQLGAAYKINDMFSVFVGARYVMANNTYQGYIRDNKVTLSGIIQNADALLGTISTQLGTAASGSQAIADEGGGSLTYAQAQQMGFITAQQQAQFEGGLTSLGYPVATPIGTAAGIFQAASVSYGAKATLLVNQEADVTQTGSGITPIIGADLNLMNNMLNIGIKYEFMTKMDVTNNTSKDITVGYTSTGTPVTQFPDGKEIPNDMPALLSVGAALNVPKLTLSAGYHQYFDKPARYGKTDASGTYIDNNSLISSNNNEIAFGVEYDINPLFLVSAGYLHATTGVKHVFQSDLSPSMSSNSGAIGGAIKFTKLLTINLGVLYTKYTDCDKELVHYVGGSTANPVNVTESYSKDNMIVAVGIDINLSK